MRAYILLLTLCVAAPAAAAPKGGKTFGLKIHFTIGVKDAAAKKPAVKAWLKKQIKTAHELFGEAPRLKISYSISTKAKVGDRTLARLSFKNDAAYVGFMKKRFGPVVRGETGGLLRAAIVDAACVKKPKARCLGRAKLLPRWLEPVSAAHGFTLVMGDDDAALAQVIGRMLGLPLSSQGGCAKVAGVCGSCKAARPGKTRKCKTPTDLMDPCPAPSRKMAKCQKAEAQKRRQGLMKGGKVSYKALTGG